VPIVNVHLVDGAHTPDQHERLLGKLSAVYAELLEAPVDRIRAFITLHPSPLWATGGVAASRDHRSAPFFTALVLEGRPVEQRHRLLERFTDVIVDVLGVDRDLVRGLIQTIPPDDWGIGGVPASVKRRAEIEARASTG
jgi:4-oxalocrotonate tautomerase family enzyme